MTPVGTNRDLPTTWSSATVGELALSVQYGLTQSANPTPVGPKFLRITDIRDDGVDWRTVPYCECDGELLKKYSLHASDLLFARTGATVGKSFLISGDIPSAVFASYLIRIRLHRMLVPAFMYYFFRSQSYWSQISEKKVGIGQPNVNGTTLSSIRLPVAPVEEQRRIVAKLEELFTKLDAGEKALREIRVQLKRYRQSVLKAAFEGKLTEQWRVRNAERGVKGETAAELLERIREERKEKLGKKFKELAPIDTSNLPELPEGWVWAKTDAVFLQVTSGSRGWARYYSDKGAAFIRISELDHDSISLDLGRVQRITPPDGAEGRRTRLGGGDILISITADVGMTAIVPDNIEEAYINQHVALARPTKLMNGTYLAWYLASEEFGQRQLRGLQRGATKVGLGLTDIGEVVLPVPSLAEQDVVVQQIDRLMLASDELRMVVERGSVHSARLRTGILRGAFEGKLVPQDPTDEPAEEMLKGMRG